MCIVICVLLCVGGGGGAICYIAICVLMWVRGDCNMRNSSLLDHIRPVPTSLHSIKTGVGIKMFINQLKGTDPGGVDGGGAGQAVYCRVEGRCDS